ncbi:MAG: RsmB/NOP family class I SAM-dependent RNA methyltransferase [Bradymonadales bacterium]|jgi:16S rRNA C967 or C1407 C5-methylase (RsmB/RsmF family)
MPQRLDFDQHLAEIFGSELPLFHSKTSTPDYIRVNSLRTKTAEICEILRAYGFEVEAVAGLENAVRILHAPYDPTQCLHHYIGYFIKQSLASQLPVHVLAPKPGESVLDLCAAPGSKTTQIATMMQNRGRLLANDYSSKRMTALAARLDANCAYNNVLMRRSAERLPHELDIYFDAVLADVPCSGLGEAQNLKENRYRYERSKNFQAFNDIQYAIALAGAKLLKVGGRLVYSTCSLNPAENEVIVNRLCKAWPLRILDIAKIDAFTFREACTSWRGEELCHDLRKCKKLMPWENETQGFFVASLEKYDEIPRTAKIQESLKAIEIIETLPFDAPEIAEILENIEHYYGIVPTSFSELRFVRNADKTIHFLHSDWHSLPATFHRAGICLAKRRGPMWRLSQAAIQQFGAKIRKNRLSLSRDQLQTLAKGEFLQNVGFEFETPYPVIDYGDLGAIAYAYVEVDGRLRWKRPSTLYVL